MNRYPQFDSCTICCMASSKNRIYDAKDATRNYRCQINYLISNNIDLEIEYKKIHIESDTIFVINETNKNNHKIFYAKNKVTWQFFIELYNDNISEKDKQIIKQLPLIIKPNIKLTEQIKSIAQNFYDEEITIDLNEDSLYSAIIKEIIAGVFSHIDIKNSKIEKSKKKIEKAIKFISNNYQKDININIIAKNCKVTPEHLSLIFKKYQYPSPIKYLWKVRIDNAIILLKNCKLSLAEIANCTGFKNVYHFSRKIKEQTGLTPKANRTIL